MAIQARGHALSTPAALALAMAAPRPKESGGDVDDSLRRDINIKIAIKEAIYYSNDSKVLTTPQILHKTHFGFFSPFLKICWKA